MRSPALAIEVKCDSGRGVTALSRDTESDEPERTGFEATGRGCEMVTGSLVAGMELAMEFRVSVGG